MQTENPYHRLLQAQDALHEWEGQFLPYRIKTDIHPGFPTTSHLREGEVWESAEGGMFLCPADQSTREDRLRLVCLCGMEGFTGEEIVFSGQQTTNAYLSPATTRIRGRLVDIKQHLLLCRAGFRFTKNGMETVPLSPDESRFFYTDPYAVKQALLAQHEILLEIADAKADLAAFVSPCPVEGGTFLTLGGETVAFPVPSNAEPLPRFSFYYGKRLSPQVPKTLAYSPDGHLAPFGGHDLPEIVAISLRLKERIA